MKEQIHITGIISADYLWDTSSFGLQNLAWLENYVTPTTPLEFLIHSDGGDVAEGLALYDRIKNLPNPKSCVIMGKCHSIATVIACAFDSITIAPHASFLIHNLSGSISGDLADMQEHLDRATKAKDSIANIYAEKTGKDAAEFMALMEKDTWLNAQEYLDLGFPGEIQGEAGPMQTLQNYAQGKLGNFAPLSLQNVAPTEDPEDPEEEKPEDPKVEIEVEPKTYTEEEIQAMLEKHSTDVLSAYKDKLKADAKLEEARKAEIEALAKEIPGQDELVNAIKADSTISAAQAKILLNSAALSKWQNGTPAPQPRGDSSSKKEIWLNMKDPIEKANYFKKHRKEITA